MIMFNNKKYIIQFIKCAASIPMEICEHYCELCAYLNPIQNALILFCDSESHTLSY